MRINLCNVHISKISTLSDKTIRVVMDMLEMPPEEMTELFRCNKGEELADITAELDETETKTPSGRLRDRLFVYYNQKFGKKEGFSTWYIETLDKIGQTYLDKLI